MTSFRVLHVDDEPDIREVVEISLGLDPAFMVRGCASGGDALAVALDWPPDLILCDVMMPAMDGPTTLAHLREQPETAHIPVVFMTARAQTRELEYFKSLGAAGVIAKPFDPMTLPAAVRSHLRAAGIATLRNGFLERLRSDAAALANCRSALAEDANASTTLDQIGSFAHALIGAAGIFGCHPVGERAEALEQAVAARLAGRGADGEVEHALDSLLSSIALC